MDPMTADQWLGALGAIGGWLAVASVTILLLSAAVTDARANLRAWRLARRDYGYREG